MLMALRFSLCVAALGLPVSATATIINVTGANLKAAFATVKAGDTLRVTGPVESIALLNRSFTSAVTIDATNARFTDTLTINNVSNLKIVGGTFGSSTAEMRTGRAVGVYNSDTITFSKNSFIGTSVGTGVGLTVAGSTGVNVSAGNFKSLKLGLGVTSSEKVRITSSLFNGMISDGINIADSHFVTASSNKCYNGAPSELSHPDCIQLWSVLGQPVQSDIMINNNIVTGATQGITSFDPENGGGLRISMIDNQITTSYPQGLACYGCVDSIFTGNVLTTLPDARWRTSMNIIGGGNNVIANNIIGAKPALLASLKAGDFGTNMGADSGFDMLAYLDEGLPDFVLQDMAYLAAFALNGDPDLGIAALNPRGVDGAGLAASGFGAMAAQVPEPMLWAQLLLGFGLAGSVMRHRRQHRAV